MQVQNKMEIRYARYPQNYMLENYQTNQNLTNVYHYDQQPKSNFTIEWIKEQTNIHSHITDNSASCCICAIIIIYSATQEPSSNIYTIGHSSTHVFWSRTYLDKWSNQSTGDSKTLTQVVSFTWFIWEESN